MFILTLIFWANLYLNTGQAMQCIEEQKMDSFSNYVSSFKTALLPLKLNRKTVFELSNSVYDTINLTYKKNIYPEIKREFIGYVPNVLRKRYPDNTFRYLFLLPKAGNFIPVIIAVDHFQDDTQNSLDLFVLLYNNNGECHRFMKIAGYKIDISEKFSEIATDFSIITKEYTFKVPPINKYPNLFYLVENQREYKIEDNGVILEKQQSSKIGYFEGNWSGYSFVEK